MTPMALVFRAGIAVMSLATGDDALALSRRDILGAWCGTASRYDFTTKTLKVRRYADNGLSNFKIVGFEFSDTVVNVMWRKADGKETWTRFGEFSADGGIMTQLPEEQYQNMPRREFRRC